MMGTEECIFCKIVAGEIPCYKIYEDKFVLSFLDIGPLSPGHTLVIPKLHCNLLDNCPPEILSSLAISVSKIARAVQLAVGSEGYNVLSNNGRAAGQLVDHLHFHIIPRNTADGVFAKWNASSYGENEATEIAKKICKNL
jgi:histidine triad (HIT) family protein